MYVTEGYLSNDDLEQVWVAPKHPPEKHEFFLYILEMFEVILRPADKSKIFIPQFLEEEETPTVAKLNELWPPGYEMEEPEFRRVYTFPLIPTQLFTQVDISCDCNVSPGNLLEFDCA